MVGRLSVGAQSAIPQTKAVVRSSDKMCEHMCVHLLCVQLQCPTLTTYRHAAGPNPHNIPTTGA
jgi:hypothetical protein